MYRGKRVALVIPAYRDQRSIAATLAGVPLWVDRVYVVDDASPDGQHLMVKQCMERDKRIRLIRHASRLGLGAATVTGYLQAVRDQMELVGTISAQNQMNAAELPALLDPLVEGNADYAKGNRFLGPEPPITRSKIHSLMTSLLSALAKLVCGEGGTGDITESFSAIPARAIQRLNWDNVAGGAAFSIDLLVRLSAYGLCVIEVPRSAGARESVFSTLGYLLRVLPVLVRGFWWRIHFKYAQRSVHPLLFFYYFGFGLGVLGLFLSVRLFFHLTTLNVVCAAFALGVGAQSFLFAMLFDREESKWDGKWNGRNGNRPPRRTSTPASVNEMP